MAIRPQQIIGKLTNRQKGLDFSYIWKETLILIAMVVVFLTLAMKKFKVRLE